MLKIVVKLTVALDVVVDTVEVDTGSVVAGILTS